MTKDTIVFGVNSRRKKIKIFGRLLSINKSYSIIQLISKEPLMMITISKKLDIKLPVLTHYLNKLDEINLLTVIIKKHPSRNRDTKYYGVKPFTLSIP